MPGRCGCSSDRCGCFIVAGDNVDVTGAGTRDNPFVVSAATVVVDDSGQPTPSGGDDRLVGEIIEYGGATAPAGWLLCDGAAISRAVYSNLFAILGTVHGAGDGATTFNLPNKTGKVTIGAGGSRPRGSTGGSETHTLATANLPSHAHSMNHSHARTSTNGAHDHPIQRSTAVGGSASTVPLGTGTIDRTGTGAISFDGAHDHSVPAYTGNTGNAGSGTPVNHMPPNVAGTFIIKH